VKTKDELVAAFKGSGLKDGDTVLVHSSLRLLGKVEGGADTVIDALLETVGAAGTIAVPTHTWSTVYWEQPVFHQTLSPSIVGTLTNIFRNRSGAVRSLHPTHSIAAIGAKAKELVSDHERDNTPCSPTSPYGKLITWKGKILLIGVGLDRCTFFHCVEELADCGTWSLTDGMEQLYSITSDGRVISVPSHRHQNGVSDNYPRLDESLRNDGIIRLTHCGDCALRVVDAAAAAGWLVPRLKENTKLLW
jgi:aminoglycoside 3-N-acetyltransferase